MSTVGTFVRFIDGRWQPPTPMPDDGIMYVWDDANLVWQPLPVDEIESE